MQATARKKRKLYERRKPLVQPEDGIIYAIGHQASGPVKIGTTVNLQRRLSEIQTGHPERLSLLAHVIVPKDRYRIEKRMHTMLASFQTTGEWFQIAMDMERLEDLVSRARADVAAEDERRRQEALAWREAKHRQRERLYKETGDRVRALRLAKEMSQDELGRAMGERNGLWVQYIENAFFPPRIEYIAALAKVLEVSADYLLGLTDSPTPAARRRVRA